MTILVRGMPGRPPGKSAKKPGRHKQPPKERISRTRDDGFDLPEISGERASYDYTPIMEDVIASGGDVTICTLREVQRALEDPRSCPHCGASLDVRRVYLACPVCAGGIKKYKRSKILQREKTEGKVD